MSKTKTLSILVGILAFINIGLLIFLLIGRPKGPRPEGFGGKDKDEKFIQDNFGFDENQMMQFRKSKDVHSSQAKSLQSELDRVSRSYYIVDGHNDIQERDSLLQEIKNITAQIYKINIEHFAEVREICKPDQLPEMENFIHGLLSRNRPGNRKRDRMRRK